MVEIKESKYSKYITLGMSEDFFLDSFLIKI